MLPEYVNAPTPMGGNKWIEYVFSTGPARRTRGRTKHTQHHEKYIPETSQYQGVQGRREAYALLAIQYLHKLGLVKRFKSQPFRTDKEEFGSEIYPDFVVELADGSISPIEVKNKRFLTRDVQLILDENHNSFANFGMKYLVWTDERPLRHSTRHHLMNMSKFAGEHIPQTEIDSLVALTQDQRAITLSCLYEEGFDMSAIYLAAWSGRLFFPLMEPWTLTTLFTATRKDSLESIFLDGKSLLTQWWDSL